MLSVCLERLGLRKKETQNTQKEIKTLPLSIPTMIGQRNHNENSRKVEQNIRNCLSEVVRLLSVEFNLVLTYFTTVQD